MKNNVKWAFFALLLAGFLGVQAQPVTLDSINSRVSSRKVAVDSLSMASHLTATMTEQLSLSEAQRLKVNDINLRFEERHRVLVDSFRGPNRDRTDFKTKMTTLRQEQDAELKAVLTADQWTTWEKWQAEHKPMKKGDRTDGKMHKGEPPTSPTLPPNDKMNQPNPDRKPAKPGKGNPPGGGG